MVESQSKESLFDDSSHNPPLVSAHIVPDLSTLEPIGVHVVTTYGDAIPCEASFISVDSEPMLTPMDETTQAWTAGISGGVVGALVGGPFFGVVAGGAAAYYSSKDGAAGDTARAMGDVARTTGKKAKEINEKHNLIDKSKQAANGLIDRVKDLDKKHSIAKKSKVAASTALEKAKAFNRKHGLIEKLGAFAVLCFQRFAKFVAEISGKLLEDGPQQDRAQATRTPQKQAQCY